MPSAAFSPDKVQEGSEKIRKDSKWFSKLYMRWTVVYWLLTLFAAGTAVSAAIKTAYTSLHPQAFSSTAKPADTPVFFDQWVIWLAAGTIVATVLQGVMRADQLADRYRFGDLLLQTSLMRFDASNQTADDFAALFAAYEHAMQMLQGGPGALGSKVQETIAQAHPALH